MVFLRSYPARRLAVAGGLCIASCAAGDGHDPVALDSFGTGGTTDGATPHASSGPGTDDVEDTSGAADPTGSGETGMPTAPQPVLARGIRLTHAYINQGVRIPLFENGGWVPPEARDAEVIAGRPAAIRAFWALPADWQGRILEGRLFVESAGETQMLQSVTQVEADSYDGDLSRTFWWVLPAELVRNDTRVRVEVWEGQPGQEDRPEPDPPPVLPVDGSAVSLGVTADLLMRLRVTVVSVDYQGRQPELDEAQRQRFTDTMFGRIPVNELEVSFHPDPMPLGPVDDFYSVLYALEEFRADDGAADDEIYYALIDTGQSSLGGAGGLAWAGGRVSAGLWWDFDNPYPYDLFVHEVGHNLGRQHSPGCGAGGPDPAYPIADGAIGVWGFNVLDDTLRNPTANKDYMGYCEPQWTSAWTWNAVATSIVALSSLGADAGPQMIWVGREAGGRTAWRRVGALLEQPPRVTEPCRLVGAQATAEAP